MAESTISQLAELHRYLLDPAGPVAATLARGTDPTNKDRAVARSRLIVLRAHLCCLVALTDPRARLGDCEAEILSRLDHDDPARDGARGLYRDLSEARTIEAVAAALRTHKHVAQKLDDALIAIVRCAE